MRFDPLSYVLGFASASGISFIIWRARRRLSVIQESAEMQIEGTRRFIGQAADTRYARDFLHFLQQRHIAGGVIDLTDLLLEPRLILGPPPALPPSTQDADMRDIFDVVPMFHDMPQSYAPFNVETLPLDDLGSGDRHIAILGIRGTGKSTALSTLALMALGQITFEKLEDLTEQAIREEEEGLPEDERKQRAKERQQIQERALEKLHDTRQEQQEKLGIVGEDERPPALNIADLLPVLVHLNDLEFDLLAYDDELLDPSEPLIRAVQRQVGTVTARVVGSVIYPALEQGRALVLLDGYDELAPKARERYYFWLQQLLATYGQNMIVIAGPVTGYEPLTALGFTPTYLRPWRQNDYDELADQWSKLLPQRSTAVEPDDQVLRRIVIDNRGRTALDVTLKIWAGLADDTRESGRVGWYDAFINRRLSKPEARDLLPLLAEQLVETGQPLDRAALEAAVNLPAGDDAKPVKPDELLDTLVKDRLMAAHPGNRYSFVHPQLASYLASETLLEPGSERPTNLALNPAWQDALSFAAGRINIMPVIYRKLGSTPNLLYSDLFEIVEWLADAPPDAPWRGDIFKRLAAALMATEQYPTVRARALAALIASRDKNVLHILRQALRAADPYIRQLACVGIGALGNPEAINDLASLLADEDEDVKLAAALALGAIGNDKAIEVMIHGLFQENHEVRRAIAEALAAIPGEGHTILRESIVAEELEIRRAAVYGLSRVRAPWALISLYRAMLEDEQWYVRTAAEEAFLAAQSPEHDGPRAHPDADSLGWLIEWAADRGEGVPAGPNARQVLIRVLQEGQPIYKMLAARTLARLGHVTALKPLYAALRDRDPGVRGTAYEALAELQVQLGQPLPGLV